MLFDKTVLVALLAASAAALPYAQQDEEPSATDGTITSTADLTAEPTEHITSSSAPATETTEPITSSSAPTAEPIEHITSSSAPATETTEPITSSSAPTAEPTEHITSSSAPATETTEPITSSSAPATDLITSTSAPATEPTESATSSAEVPATQTSSSPSTSSSASASTGNGGVQIVNNLGRDVYVNTGNGGVQRIRAGGTMNHDWASDGTGVSLKMGTSANSNSVLQFEYTANGDVLYWDVSSIDLNANSDIVRSGFTVTPSDSSCKSATCAAGDSNCADSYQTPTDLNTNFCSTSAQYVVALG